MALKLARKLVKDIADYEASNGRKSASIIWHGGEPLLAGIDFYERVFSHQKRSSVSFRNSFQTNGELITQEWCDFFNRNKCSVGFSLDGPPQVHDRQRKTRNGCGTAFRVLQGIDLCRRNGISFGGVICVVTSFSSKYPTKILDYFYSKDIKTIDFLPAHNSGDEARLGRDQYAASPEEFSAFMKGVFDWYLQKNDPGVEIRTLSNVMTQLFGGRSSLCNMQGDQCGTFLTVYPDGKVLFCCDYHSKKLDEVGDVTKDSITQIVQGSKFKTMRVVSMQRLDNCGECEVLPICHGGCPRDWSNKASYWCQYYRDFYYYCYEKIVEILQGASRGILPRGIHATRAKR
jgi:uncharacterized protein